MADASRWKLVLITSLVVAVVVIPPTSVVAANNDASLVDLVRSLIGSHATHEENMTSQHAAQSSGLAGNVTNLTRDVAELQKHVTLHVLIDEANADPNERGTTPANASVMTVVAIDATGDSTYFQPDDFWIRAAELPGGSCPYFAVAALPPPTPAPQYYLGPIEDLSGSCKWVAGEYGLMILARNAANDARGGTLVRFTIH